MIKSSIPKEECKLMFSDEQRKQLRTGALKLMTKKDKDENDGDKKYYKEYYRIDLTAFTVKKAVSGCYDFKKCECNLDIAIEYENNYKNWCDEMLKLAFISCPLRVVIAYSGLIEDGERKDECYLNEVANVFSNIRKWSYKKKSSTTNTNFKYYV